MSAKAWMARLLAAEASFDPLLKPYRVRADHIMASMNGFLLLVCLGLAPLHDTLTTALTAGVPLLALSLWLVGRNAGALITRLFMASAFMIFTSLIIHQTGGDVEAHFMAFGLIGVLLYYRDWRTIATATLVAYLLHLVLGYAQTIGAAVHVFNDPRIWSRLCLHLAYFLPFVGMMAYLAIWLRRDGHESQHVIALAQRIVQGNLIEEEDASINDHDMPLIAAVRQMKSRLLDLLRVIPIAAAVIRIDTDTVVSVNQAWERSIGPLDAVGTRFGDASIWADPETWQSLLRRLHDASQTLLDKVEVVLRKTDGTPILCELSLILHADVHPVMAVLTVEDVTLRRRAEETMQRLAYRDMLTDLPNRVSLHDALTAAVGAWHQHQKPFAVVMLDLDGFKPVNDKYGHAAGDEVLRVIGARLTHVNRVRDVAARLGGDEFAIVLNDCADIESAAVIAQRFIDGISRPIRLETAKTAVRVGASAGVAHISSDIARTDGDTLLKQADTALYAAKKAGKNRVERYSAPGPASKPA